MDKLFDLIKKYTDDEPIDFPTYLTHRKRDPEDYPLPLRNDIKAGFVVTANEEAMERMIFAKSFRDLGYETFVVEEAKENDLGRIAVAPLKSDLEAVLWMQSGHNVDEMMPMEIVKTLGDWRDYCDFHLTGAGSNWIKIEFEDLPNDVLAFAQLISEFCPQVLHGSIHTDEDLSEALQNERSILMRWRSDF